jgi:hypothetical protein
MTALVQYRQPAPTAQDASLARTSGARLAHIVRKRKPLSLKVMELGKEQPIELPAGAVALLSRPAERLATIPDQVAR